MPSFEYENELWAKGHKIIIGCDEVGRGCFAGPVVAGAVVWPQNFNHEVTSSAYSQFTIYKQIPIINDSKKLSEKQREIASVWIKEHSLGWGLGEVSVGVINKIGLGKACHLAFRKAIAEAQSSLSVDFLLTDAFYIPGIKDLGKDRQLPIIKGDQKSFSIAAASVIAKVYRDELMKKLGKKPEFQNYSWHTNKGYGTKEHRENILKHGVSKYHRTQFVETWLRKSNSTLQK